MLGCKSSLGLEAGHRPKSSLGLGVTECQAQAVTIDSLWWPQHLADGAAILFSLSLSLNQYPGHQEVLLILVLLPQTFSSSVLADLVPCLPFLSLSRFQNKIPFLFLLFVPSLLFLG